ncbi:MAG: hypothetical protein ACR2LX_15070 [Jatrophihabitans sp.]
MLDNDWERVSVEQRREIRASVAGRRDVTRSGRHYIGVVRVAHEQKVSSFILGYPSMPPQPQVAGTTAVDPGTVRAEFGANYVDGESVATVYDPVLGERERDEVDETIREFRGGIVCSTDRFTNEARFAARSGARMHWRSDRTLYSVSVPASDRSHVICALPALDRTLVHRILTTLHAGRVCMRNLLDIPWLFTPTSFAGLVGPVLASEFGTLAAVNGVPDVVSRSAPFPFDLHGDRRRDSVLTAQGRWVQAAEPILRDIEPQEHLARILNACMSLEVTAPDSRVWPDSATALVASVRTVPGSTKDFVATVLARGAPRTRADSITVVIKVPNMAALLSAGHWTGPVQRGIPPWSSRYFMLIPEHVVQIQAL